MKTMQNLIRKFTEINYDLKYTSYFIRDLGKNSNFLKDRL